MSNHLSALSELLVCEKLALYGIRLVTAPLGGPITNSIRKDDHLSKSVYNFIGSLI